MKILKQIKVYLRLKLLVWGESLKNIIEIFLVTMPEKKFFKKEVDSL